MPNTPTPGEVAWRAYQHRDPMHFWDEWAKLHAIERQAWEAAAQAVQLETCQRALAVVRHWNEFGPEYDFAEKIDALESWLATQALPAGEEDSDA